MIELDAWRDVANRVLAGEFDEADQSTIESLTIGLRHLQDPICQQALRKLPKNKEKS
jgi:hypothetical protein